MKIWPASEGLNILTTERGPGAAKRGAENLFPPRVETKNLSLYYSEAEALKDITMQIPPRAVTALIGPSGCGKSTFLRTINRMNDLIAGVRITGQVLIDGSDIYKSNIDLPHLRRRVGMVFQRPNPFPKSTFENVAYGARRQGINNRGRLAEIVEQSLHRAALWDEVKDRMHRSALALSGGQQQRLCIARALAVEPEIILMDEPASALDPISTAKIEDLITELKSEVTIIIVTHNMQQAGRVSDRTAFFLHGSLIEYGKTEQVFQRPVDSRTEDYITGRFG